MKRAILLCLCVLPACTAIREARQHAPSATYESARSEPALEHCLAGNLSWISLPTVVRGEHDTELTFGSGEQAVVLVTLVPTPSGTHVEVRELLAYGVRVRNNITACVTGRDA